MTSTGNEDSLFNPVKRRHQRSGLRKGGAWALETVVNAVGLAGYREKLHSNHRSLPTFTQLMAHVSTLRQRTPIDRPVYVTGHSMGGALATLFTAQWIVETSPHAVRQALGGVYTFGAPRLGDASFAALINRAVGNRFFRLVYENDFIPRLPFAAPRWVATWLGGRRHGSQNLLCYVAGVAAESSETYTHAGQLMYIDGGLNRVVPKASLADIAMFQLAGLLRVKIILGLEDETKLRLLLRLVFPFFWNDHLICDYVRELHRCTGTI